MNIARKFGISDGAVRLVRVTPRPFARAFGAFGDIAVLVDMRVDKLNVAVVRFGLFVQKFENTFRACKPHDDRVDLHGDLPDVQCELAGHIEERHDDADAHHALGKADDGQVARADHDENARHDGDDDEHEMPYIHDGGHENVTVFVRLVGSVAQFVVDFIEIALCLLFVAEHLDDFLSAHHFFDKTFRFADDDLLADKVFGAVASHVFCDYDHERHAREHHDHQPDAVNEHDDEQRDRSDDGIEGLRNALRNELPQSVGIVGIGTHDIAVRVRIEIADRQCLHAVEHIVSDIHQKALRDDRHALVIENGRRERDEIHCAHAADDKEQRFAHGFPRCAVCYGFDDLIDDEA